jgi:hypothetical protein
LSAKSQTQHLAVWIIQFKKKKKDWLNDHVGQALPAYSCIVPHVGPTEWPYRPYLELPEIQTTMDIYVISEENRTSPALFCAQNKIKYMVIILNPMKKGWNDNNFDK